MWIIVRMYRNLSKTVVCPSGRLYACHGFQSVTGASKCEILKHDSPHHTHPARPGESQVLNKLDDEVGVLAPLIPAVSTTVADCPNPSIDTNPSIDCGLEQVLEILGHLQIQ